MNDKITNIDKFIQYTNHFHHFQKNGSVQTNIVEPSIYKEFLQYLHDITDYTRVDELTSFHRKESKLTF